MNNIKSDLVKALSLDFFRLYNVFDCKPFFNFESKQLIPFFHYLELSKDSLKHDKCKLYASFLQIKNAGARIKYKSKSVKLQILTQDNAGVKFVNFFNYQNLASEVKTQEPKFKLKRNSDYFKFYFKDLNLDTTNILEMFFNLVWYFASLKTKNFRAKDYNAKIDSYLLPLAKYINSLSEMEVRNLINSTFNRVYNLNDTLF